MLAHGKEILSPLAKNRKSKVTTSFDDSPPLLFLPHNPNQPSLSSIPSPQISLMPPNLMLSHDHLFTHVA